MNENSSAKILGAYRLPLFAALLLAGGAVTACSGGNGIGISPVVSPTQQAATFPAAIATGCIAPSAQTQTVALPPAGGLSGTITLGAFTGSSSSCLNVTVATGTDATLTGALSTTKSTKRHALAGPLPSPLAQIDLNNTVANVTWLSVSFQLQPPAIVPAGNYPVTIATTVDLGDGQTSTTVANYTMAVSSSGTAAIVGPLATLNLNTTGLLTIYPAGTVLPTPAPTATPSPTPAPSATSSAPASPTATPTASATPTIAPSPTPTPAVTPTSVPTTGADCTQTPYPPCGSYVANGYYDGGSSSGQTVLTTPQPIYIGNPSAVFVPGQYFVGTVTITLSTYHPGMQQVVTNSCPASVAFKQSGTDGKTYALTFPADGQAQEFNNPTASAVGCYLSIGPSQNVIDKFLDFSYINGF